MKSNVTVSPGGREGEPFPLSSKDRKWLKRLLSNSQGSTELSALDVASLSLKEKTNEWEQRLDQEFAPYEVKDQNRINDIIRQLASERDVDDAIDEDWSPERRHEYMVTQAKNTVKDSVDNPLFIGGTISAVGLVFAIGTPLGPIGWGIAGAGVGVGLLIKYFNDRSPRVKEAKQIIQQEKAAQTRIPHPVQA